MDITFSSSAVKGCVRAISSKSEAHRALICASISDRETKIICTDTNADIDATVACLTALGASIRRVDDGFVISPIRNVLPQAVLDANESGSTLRFLLPLVASLGANCQFIMRGRLASRPLSPLYELLAENGVTLSETGKSPLSVSGRLCAGRYTLEANISSQYISGMLFALSIAHGKSVLRLSGKIESAPYILMTLDTLIKFGAEIEFDTENCTFYINGKERLVSPSLFEVGGDWSNAAFQLCAGTIGSRAVTVSNLDAQSRQGDRAIIDVLRRMGADIAFENGNFISHPSRLCGTRIDAADIPDLVPILCVAAAVADGETVIYNAQRLRLKESDRIESVCTTLSALGADILATDDGMIICGKSRLSGGLVDSFNDHRIAMSAAVASLVCDGAVTVSRFEAINKSFPSFLENFESI